MRWFRRKSADRPLTVDPARQEALIADIRRRFGGHVPGTFQEQAGSLVQVLGGDDGLAVADRIVHETADQAHAEVRAQATALGHGLNRRDYRALLPARRACSTGSRRRRRDGIRMSTSRRR